MNNEELDREPEKDSWDILFTKYVDSVPDMTGNLSPYIVTGATSNVDIAVNHFHPVGPAFDDWTSKPLDSLKNKIGWDWKSFDLDSFSWKLTDSNYYFVQSYSGDIFKLRFTSWSGSMTGNFVLEKTLTSASSIFESSSAKFAADVYPNPANSSFTIKINEEISGSAFVTIFDQAGRMVYNNNVAARDLNYGMQVSNLNLQDGLYIISITGNDFSANTRLLIQ
jgi:hypothetical protein